MRLGKKRQNEDEPVPGPLGWLELTIELMRDRSHSSWMTLRDDELLRVLRERRLVAAYLPGEEIAMPGLVLVRLAVALEGQVALVAPDGTVTTRPEVEEAVTDLLDALKTVAFVPPDGFIGPSWLDVVDIIEEGQKASQDARIVACYRGKDTLAVSTWAKGAEAPVTLWEEAGWHIAAFPRGTEPALALGLSSLSMYPFAILERQGQRRAFAHLTSAKSSLNVFTEWEPELRPGELPDGASVDAVELGRWLATPSRFEDDPEPPTIDGATPAQLLALEAWLSPDGNGDGLIGPTAAAYEVPDLAVRLVEAAPDTPDPDGGRVVEPAGTLTMMGKALREQDTEPRGRNPWSALGRLLWRNPGLGIALGIGELLVAVVLFAFERSVDGPSIWAWVLIAVFGLGGLAHIAEGVTRLRWRSRGPAQD